MWGLRSWGPGAPSGGRAARGEDGCVPPFMWMPCVWGRRWQVSVDRSHGVPGGGQKASSRLHGMCLNCFKGRLKAPFPLKIMLRPARPPSPGRAAAGLPALLSRVL